MHKAVPIKNINKNDVFSSENNFNKKGPNTFEQPIEMPVNPYNSGPTKSPNTLIKIGVNIAKVPPIQIAINIQIGITP